MECVLLSWLGIPEVDISVAQRGDEDLYTNFHLLWTSSTNNGFPPLNIQMEWTTRVLGISMVLETQPSSYSST